ncbi:MAG TPA: c-type cytochrome [Pyrinomonadaceae bacterium]|nr:c-type cytochrome [Pyrinomonadaceae bacterium]
MMTKSKFDRNSFLATLAVALFAVSISVVVSTPAASQAAQQPTASTEQTVEQVQKNIKVLNGMPQSQLIPAMNFMSASLGVRCTFCHVNKDGKWDFVSDEKPEKNTAREMIRMVLSVNKNTFKGNTEVSCFTCHHGQTHPASSPSLPLPEATPRPVAAQTPAGEPKPTAPTAEQILAKYSEALGGTAAVEKIKTRTLKGTLVTSNGVTLDYQAYQSGPSKIYVVLNTPKQGTFERGFDGAAGWEKSSRGVRALGDEELANLRRYSSLFRDLDLKDQFSRVTFAGKDKIGDREVYVLRAATSDNHRERLYFDVQTGLLVRRITSTPTIIGVIPEQVDFEDYRNVDGVMMPFTVRISSVDPNITSTRKFTEIKLNAPIDETKFAKPAPPPAPAQTPGG